jgi:F420-dependent oxidoreductase-like protein
VGENVAMTSPRLGYGVQIACEGMSWPECLDIAQAAESLGYHSVWLPDHYVATPDGLVPDIRTPLLDGWTTLGAIAQATRRIRLGPLVASNTFRHPAILAKLAATLDHLSGGRAECGMGAGWFDLEHTSLGIPFPPVAERLRALDEAVQIVRALWTRDSVDFDGRYYQLKGAVSQPRPVQRPGPPIVIGAFGDKVGLRNAARHADHWNVYCSPDLYRQKCETLSRHCAAAGRDPASILRSVMIPVYLDEDDKVRAKIARWPGGRDWFLVGDPAEIAGRIGRYTALGADLIIVQVDRTGRCVDDLRRFAETFMRPGRAI